MKMIATFLCGALALVLTSPVFADDVETQLNAQQASMLRLQNDFMQLQSQLDAQNGRIEELEHEISNLKSVISSMQAAGTPQPEEKSTPQAEPPQSASKSEAKAQNSGITAVTDAKGNALKSVNDEAKKSYDAAYQQVVDNKLKGAAQAFKAYLEKYPDNELTPNAWYWLGQVQYKQKQYSEARVSFLNAQSFKNSPKRPDSLYKLGLITKEQGDEAKAKRYFEVLVKNYPDDTSAQLAKKLLNN